MESVAKKTMTNNTALNHSPNGTRAIGSNARQNDDVLFSALEAIDCAHLNVAEVPAQMFRNIIRLASVMM